MKKLITALLLFAILSMTFLSCDEIPDNDTNTTTAAGKSTIQTESTTAGKLLPNLPTADLKGEEYKFYVMGKERNVNNYSIEIFSEAENGEVINDAVYQRNIYLQEKYNMKITEVPEKVSDLAATVMNSLRANEDLYSVFMMNISQSNNLARQGLLQNLNNVENIDLEQAWWDKKSNVDFSILNRSYYVTGDINIMDNNATWAVFFNKKILKDLAIELPYQAVLDYKWTIDKYIEMNKAASKDLDGDSKMNYDTDRWGTVGDYMNTYMFYIGAGEKITEKNKNGEPELNMYSERGASVINKVMEIQLDANSTILANKATGYANTYEDLLRRNFKNDQALFYVAGMLSYTLLRNMESEYGMLPLPLYDEKQTSYNTTYNYNNASVLSIPITNGRIDETGLIVEAMAAESMYTLTPAYYIIALERKYMRDTESVKMLDIILESRSFDLAMVYNWGGSYSLFDSMTGSGSTDFASKCEAIATAVTTDIEKTLKDYESIK